jgi:hypothetical protein
MLLVQRLWKQQELLQGANSSSSEGISSARKARCFMSLVVPRPLPDTEEYVRLVSVGRSDSPDGVDCTDVTPDMESDLSS